MTTCRVVGAILLVVVIGCGGDDDPVAPPYQSGTRLRANLWDGGGGATLFAGWHDTMLNEGCQFAVAADGVQRCLPSGGQVGYTDAACTTKVMVVSAEDRCGTPRFARAAAHPDQACGPGGEEVFAVGAPQGMGPTYWRDESGCHPGADMLRFTLAAPLAPTTFVGEASRIVEDRGGRLNATIVTTDDGARFVSNLIDPERGPCQRFSIDSATDEEGCVAGVGYAGELTLTYADSTCTTPADATQIVFCPDPATPAAIVTRTGTPGSCDLAFPLHLVGPARSATLYSKRTGTCGLATDVRGFEIGRLATADDFPVLRRAELGDGALRASYIGDQARRPLLASGLELPNGEDCSIVRDANGIFYCLPGDTTFGRYRGPSTTGSFADPACTDPVISFDPMACGAVRPTRVADFDFGCQESTVFGVKALVEHTGPVYSNDTGTCVSIPRPSGIVILAQGSTIELSTFPVVTARHE